MKEEFVHRYRNGEPSRDPEDSAILPCSACVQTVLRNWEELFGKLLQKVPRMTAHSSLGAMLHEHVCL